VKIALEVKKYLVDNDFLDISQVSLQTTLGVLSIEGNGQLSSSERRPCKFIHVHCLQDHLEAILFNVMRTRGFEDEYIKRYKMVTKFFQQRRPLIVLICGVPCTGEREEI
jgi:hypothetical protein